jgi:hypothetical protein
LSVTPPINIKNGRIIIFSLAQPRASHVSPLHYGKIDHIFMVFIFLLGTAAVFKAKITSRLEFIVEAWRRQFLIRAHRR